MNFAGHLFIYILSSFVIIFVKCEFSWTNYLYNTIAYVPCQFMECCSDEYVSPDVDKLDDLLAKNLYGQDIAQHVVVSALRGHSSRFKPPKALVMSFHGPPGTGKTYVAQMIARSFYKKGDKSRFYHFFNGRNDFPLHEDVELYKVELRQIIMNSLSKCERSLFIFDEVDKMPEGLLNVLVPFLDYNTQFKLWRLYGTTVSTEKAIFIFLSNTGSSRIIQHLLSLWEEGKHRSKAKLHDFENLISVGAFNEKGGLHHSDAIDTNLIDHYVPFLPLEEIHVKQCLSKAFENRNVSPTKELVQEGLSYTIFGPPPHNLYATAGCKRLEQKVAAIVYNKRKQAEKNEL